MSSFRDGTVNLAGIVNPGVLVDQILPTPFITGVPTNIEGLVGVGTWGPVNSAQYFTTLDDCAAVYGTPQARTYDLPFYVQTARKEGGAVGFCGIRVSDGTDTAAFAVIPGGAGRATARYSGTRGNLIGLTLQASAAAGCFAAIVSFPGRAPERFDSIAQALQSVTVAPGTGYTSVPTAMVSAPQRVGGVAATVQPSLVSVTQTLGSGGTGHAVGDVVTFGAGVQIRVTAIGTGGVITTFTVLNPGAITSGNTLASYGTQTSSSGVGIGATLTLLWGLGTPTFTNGSGYLAGGLTLTLMGGGSGAGFTAGTYTPVQSFWAALAQAINVGTLQQGRSRYIVFTSGTSTASPTLGVATLLTGGTDGASGVNSAIMVGQDTQPRTGMYALRRARVDALALCDVTDPSTWGAQLSFGISESAFPVTATAGGDTILGAVATRASFGIDDPSIWILQGDWPTVYDDTAGYSRLASPQAVAIGRLGNLSPELSPINKPCVSVLATQTSSSGVLISDADEANAQVGGIDLIGKSSALNADYFTFLTGRNASSNTAANGVEYTRLTNFLIRSIDGGPARSIVGRLQSTRPDDQTRADAKNLLDNFFQNLVDPDSGSGGNGKIDSFSVVCDLTNNPLTLQAMGFLFAFCAVRYLNTVRYFVIKLAGGGNVPVTVTSQATPPSVSQLL